MCKKSFGMYILSLLFILGGNNIILTGYISIKTPNYLIQLGNERVIVGGIVILFGLYVLFIAIKNCKK